jgi:uncharacterized BrkB/YihY/UPF0761 family membrane protein
VNHQTTAVLLTEPPAVPVTGEAAAGGGDRLAAVRDWLHGHADRPLARLALLWLRRYLEASRNSGAAASIYFTLSALPTALVVIAFFNLAAKNENAFSNRLIAHMKLDATTANLVRQLFGSTSNNVLAATLTIVFGFLLWGLGIGQVYRDLYARAWRIQVGSITDQVRFAIWFFAASGLVALLTLSAANLRSDGWLVLVPAWIAASIIFWLWTPRFLLHRKVTLRALFPGALLASLVLGATVATAPLWTGPTVNQNAHAFGSFGVVIALLAYIFTVITISMACAVFSPVWAEWRETEKARKKQLPTPSTPVVQPTISGDSKTTRGPDHQDG